ncbi:MAG: rod shape-determining protein MreD [Parvibaculaceae bacterium]|jgi:rod shape-determining protein MreD|nr:hypothetical protein [Parvibaculaceae bacterium]
MDPIGPTSAVRAGKFVLLLLPFVIGVACVLLSFVPLSSIIGLQVAPLYALIVVYFWSIHQPDVLPPYAILVIGLLYDLLSYGPIGLWTVIFLATYGFVQSQRLVLLGRPFVMFWLGFAITAGLAGSLAWSMASLYNGVWISAWPVVSQILATVIVFPIFVMLFSWASRSVNSTSS